MIVSLINNRLLFIIDFAPLTVNVLQIALILEMKMPGHEYVLFFEFPLAHAFLAFDILLKSPYVD